MSIPTTHAAALLPSPKSRHQVQDRNTPSLGPDEVLIKITATAINPVDWKMRDKSVLLKTYPAVLGSDAAGEIAVVGAQVQNFKPGDRVFFQGYIRSYDSCTFQKYCKMPAALVGKTPSKISDEEAAGVCLATVAVITGAYDKTGQGITPPWDKGGESVGKGKAAVVLGGSSSVGQYAIQFARLSGYERIITNSSASHREFLESLGATHVLDRSKATAADFKAAAGDLNVEYVQDAISSPETQKFGVEILRQFNGGNVVIVQLVDEEAAEFGKADAKKVQIKQVMGLGSDPNLRYLSEPLMEALGGEDGWIAKGKFFPNRVQVVPGGLDAVDEALDMNKKGVSGVKLVIQPQVPVEVRLV